MQSIIVTTLYLLSIFVPLIFTTINSELFEFPKFILLLSGTLVITVAWIIHILKTRDYQITRAKNISPIHIGILAVLITQIISTLFSINPYTSFWGYYSRFHQGLLTTICYTIIYFAAVKWLDNKSTLKLIKISVSTAIIISLFAISEHFGIDKNYWIQDVASRPFATLGQPNWLAAYLLPNIFLTLYLHQTSTRAKNISPPHYIVFLVLITALLFTKSRSGLLAFSLSYLTYWLLIARQFSFAKIKRSLIIFTIPTFIAIFANIPHFTRIIPVNYPAPQGTTLETGGTESGNIRKIVWTGALRLIIKHPILGTGPETFAYTYYWARPTAHNLTSEWDFLYNKAHNEYLNIAATTGILGLLAYLSWHLAIIFVSLKQIAHTKKVSQDKEDSLRMFYPVLGASVVGFTITNFFGFSVIPVYLMMILIAALPNIIINVPLEAKYFSPAYIFILIILIYPLRLFLADIYYARGKATNSIHLLQKALAIRPGLDLYHAQLGEISASKGQTDLALHELAINKTLNPYHLNFYKSRAKIYLTLANIDPKYYIQAAEELESARTLAPTDPKLAYNLGLVYIRLDKNNPSIKNLQDALTLKPNYAEPYYALTLLYEETKQTNLIPPLLKSATANLATYSAQLKAKIDRYIH
ncbi:hypothetical protein COT87_00805 [Candidatus Collierbacteria bacterium CG10_big_fil_rev_8_21_14_0_10_44_9]|uniref:O-antigen ligase-related domain-containing protein n=1 Tax=Candidatus Collierbacteria bacterium CG10_big_fil_rev_8_21_14_0_10_44_9 TaxID=1974535 RepID=A0A2H0VJ96_9BACT|nr:MAG: hypothetical protein COT87_00805 [Candidatus Collierbacteria bacterium CG10_big_fil_rev_8_21_14_0_10_44_9]